MSKDMLSREPYMAFVDGSLDYNCIECKDNCCKGFGFGGMQDGIIDSLIDKHPKLLAWINARENGFISLVTPKSGCLFLRNDGRCQIELTSGRSAKPGACLLFPFNRLNLIGDQLVVRPHFLCRQFEYIAPPRPNYVTGSHAAIFEDLRTTGMTNMSMPRINIHPSEDVPMTLAREQEFRDACGEAIGHGQAYKTIIAFSQNVKDLIDFKNRAIKLIGPISSQHVYYKDFFDDMLHTVLPAKRLDFLTLSVEGRLRALILADSLIRGSFLGLSAIPKINDLSSFFDVVGPLLKVIAYGEEPFDPLMGWNADDVRPPLDGVDHKIAFGTMIILTNKGYGTIQALEVALAPVLKPFERVLFMRRLAALDRPPILANKMNKDNKNVHKYLHENIGSK